MRQFIRTTVPSDSYQEIKQIGNKYLVHLDAESDGNDGILCYEILVDSEPNLEDLQIELNLWKLHLQAIELRIVKNQKFKEINDYDTSTSVNSFELRNNGTKVIDYWLSRDLRTSLQGDVQACSKISNTYKFDIRELGISLNLNCEKFLEALDLLRQYAYTAYNVTSQHLANVNNLQTVSEVENYDYTINYPSKLIFNIEDLV